VLSRQGVRSPLAAAPGSSALRQASSTPCLVERLSGKPGTMMRLPDQVHSRRRTIIVALHGSAFTSIHCLQSRQRTIQAITLTTSISMIQTGRRSPFTSQPRYSRDHGASWRPLHRLVFLSPANRYHGTSDRGDHVDRGLTLAQPLRRSIAGGAKAECEVTTPQKSGLAPA
jgi:hypothetical protein